MDTRTLPKVTFTGDLDTLLDAIYEAVPASRPVPGTVSPMAGMPPPDVATIMVSGMGGPDGWVEVTVPTDMAQEDIDAILAVIAAA